MTDQTQVSIATKRVEIEKIHIGENDETILRELAKKLSELANRPVEGEKRNLWYRHNALHETRPLIFCDPENGWNEIINIKDMRCNGELAREWEMMLRKEIFWGESMGDDRVTEPVFDIPYVYEETDWGMHEIVIGGENGGSYVWDAPLKSYNDIDKLRFPEIQIDYEATQKLFDIGENLFRDSLRVRLHNRWWWSLGMTWMLIKLRGYLQVMYDTYDHPDELKSLMAFLRDGTLDKLDYLEKNGLLHLNNDGTYVGSGGFGWTNELPQPDFNGQFVRTRDMWGFCESQETTTFSPEMFEEFIFPYQLPILDRFGLNCYGCCEPLDTRWHIVKNIPKLRRVSVSPWSNQRDMADKLGNSYIYSLKPSPTDLAVPVINEEKIRKGLREVIQLTRNCRVEIIMKDNHTIGKNPNNVIQWCHIAREEAENS